MTTASVGQSAKPNQPTYPVLPPFAAVERAEMLGSVLVVELAVAELGPALLTPEDLAVMAREAGHYARVYLASEPCRFCPRCGDRLGRRMELRRNLCDICQVNRVVRILMRDPMMPDVEIGGVR